MTTLPFPPPEQQEQGSEISNLMAELETAMAKAQPEEVPAIIGDLERMKTTLLVHALAEKGKSQERTESGDLLLTVGEAAKLLGTTTGWLYENADKLPFTIRLSRGQLRFSAQKIQKFIRQRAGR